VSYIPDPSNRDSPLSIEEVEALIARGGRDLSKGRTLTHFLNRVWHTIRMYQGKINDLNKDIDRISLRQGAPAGFATTLNPRDAVQFLSLEERSELAEKTMREYMSRLHKVLTGLERERETSTRYANALHFAIIGLLDDPGIPPELRRTLADLDAKGAAVVAQTVGDAAMQARRELDSNPGEAR
jgi:hypothetical protein